MNQSNLEHGWLAVVLQLMLAIPFGFEVAGYIAIAVFVGREYAQAEYKLKVRSGWVYGQKMELMPWDVLKPSLWSKDALMDIVLPVITTTAVTLSYIHLIN